MCIRDRLNYDTIDLVSIEKRDGNAQETGYDLTPVNESYPAPDNDNVTPIKDKEDDDEKGTD